MKKVQPPINPLKATLNGNLLVLSKAKTILLTLTAVVLIFMTFTGIASLVSSLYPASAQTTSANQELTPEQLAALPVVLSFLTIIALGAILIGVYIGALFDYTTARAAEGKKVTLTDAAKNAYKHYLGYFVVMCIVFVRTILWSFLFIIPGFYKSVRYSFAGVAYFADTENNRGTTAVDYSYAITKNSWVTVIGSASLLAIAASTFGAILLLGLRTELFKTLSNNHEEKLVAPRPHWLSYLSVCCYIFSFIIMGIILLGYLHYLAPTTAGQ